MGYAAFLTDVRKDHDRAQKLYERALKANPNDAIVLGNYAAFLTGVRKKYDRARKLYEHALKADPNDANNLGNFAGLMFILNNGNAANELLQRAIAAETKDPAENLATELCFYVFANGPEKGRPAGLAKLKRLLVKRGARSPDWDLSKNVERATKDRHPDSKWLGKLADVINGKADPSVLDDWPAWKNTKV